MKAKIQINAELLALLQIFDHRTGLHFARMAHSEGCLRGHDLVAIVDLCRPCSYNLPGIAEVLPQVLGRQ